MPVALRMPALSPTMKDGTLARWCVKEGDKVEPGSLLAEVETDKALMEYECADEGWVARLLVEQGSKNVPVNKVIAILREEGDERTKSRGIHKRTYSRTDARKYGRKSLIVLRSMTSQLIPCFSRCSKPLSRKRS